MIEHEEVGNQGVNTWLRERYFTSIHQSFAIVYHGFEGPEQRVGCF